MEVHAATQKAKEHVAEMYQEEPILQVGLEEVAFEQAKNVWMITIGFVRDWRPQENRSLELNTPKRTYNIVRIRDQDGGLESLKTREVAEES